MKTIIDLKPCPWCGETKGLEYALADRNRKVNIWCGKCGAEGPCDKSMDGAAAAWNNRISVNCGTIENIKELKEFVRVITLSLQAHRSKTPKELDRMFQRAYQLYAKYDVEAPTTYKEEVPS